MTSPPRNVATLKKLTSDILQIIEAAKPIIFAARRSYDSSNRLGIKRGPYIKNRQAKSTASSSQDVVELNELTSEILQVTATAEPVVKKRGPNKKTRQAAVPVKHDIAGSCKVDKKHS